MNRKRLIAFMLMLFLYSGTLFAQKVTISFHNESMSQALKRLERVSGYRILFTYEDVEGYKVNHKAKNEEFASVIQALLAGTPLDYAVDGKLVNITLREHKQIYENEKKTSSRRKTEQSQKTSFCGRRRFLFQKRGREISYSERCGGFR